MKIKTIIVLIIIFLLGFSLGILLFRQYKGCYDYSCIYLCGDNPNWLTKLFYRCAWNTHPEDNFCDNGNRNLSCVEWNGQCNIRVKCGAEVFGNPKPCSYYQQCEGRTEIII